MENKIKKNQSDLNIRNINQKLTLNENEISLNKKINNNNDSSSKLLSETISQNKKLKYNNSLTSFNNTKIINKNKSEKNLVTTLSSSDMANIKNDILGIYKIKKDKNLRSFNSNFNEKNLNKSKSQRFSADKCKYNENKYEIYNREHLAYKIYHDYQKVNFNHENKPFLERMELYGIKKNLKDIKIEELIKLKSPKMSEKKRETVLKNILNRKHKDNTNTFNINFNCNMKKVSKKELNEIVMRLYTAKKREKTKKEKNKDKEENTKDKDTNDKTEDVEGERTGVVVDIKNNKKNIKKLNSKEICELNNRLYYKELNKKDIPYKLFLKKIDELFGITYDNNNNNNNDIIQNYKYSNDYMSYTQLLNTRLTKNNNNNTNNTKYIFKDNDDEDCLINNNKEINNNNVNNANNPNNVNNDKNISDNQLYNLSNIQHIINNNNNIIKSSSIIDNFFCDK